MYLRFLVDNQNNSNIFAYIAGHTGTGWLKAVALFVFSLNKLFIVFILLIFFIFISLSLIFLLSLIYSSLRERKLLLISVL